MDKYFNKKSDIIKYHHLLVQLSDNKESYMETFDMENKLQQDEDLVQRENPQLQNIKSEIPATSIMNANESLLINNTLTSNKSDPNKNFSTKIDKPLIGELLLKFVKSRTQSVIQTDVGGEFNQLLDDLDKNYKSNDHPDVSTTNNSTVNTVFSNDIN